VVLASGGVAHATTCHISATFAVSFPGYHGSAGNVDSTGSITITCSAPVKGITIALGTTGPGARRMRGPVDVLGYELYLDPQRTVAWGDSSFGSETMGPMDHPGGTISVPVYGRIFAGQKVHAGGYGDSLQILVSY